MQRLAPFLYSRKIWRSSLQNGVDFKEINQGVDMMTIKNKILAILLAVSFNAFAAAWTGSNSEPENMKKIDGKAFYVITTADELAWFAVQVNSGRTAINGVLGNDIVFGANTNSLNTANWTPIGKDSSRMFSGIFDGANHTIYGLNSNQSNFSGLFGVTDINAIVQNTSMKSGKSALTASNGKVGAFVGHNNGSILNCSNYGAIVLNSSAKNYFIRYGGGITGWNAGEISSSKNVGTITFSDSSSKELYFGGISGYNAGTISKSENSGPISIVLGGKAKRFNESKLDAYVGGVVGNNTNLVDLNGNLANISVSTNSIVHDVETNVDNWPKISCYSGGFVGLNSGAVKRSFNKGSSLSSVKIQIAAKAYANSAGFAVVNKGQILDSYNMGSYSASISGGYGTGSGTLQGGMFTSNSGTVKTSYCTKDLKYWLSNTALSANADNMKKDQFAWILNTTNGTTSNSDVWSRNGDYPIFANESNHAIYKVIFNDEGVTTNRYTNNKGLATFPDDPEPAEGYIFTGWYNSNDIRVKPTTVFSADQTVNAVYVDASNVFWTINFYNTDAKSTLLETKSYQHGSVVAYNGETPTKETTAQYTYSFKGWDAEITNAVENFDYHAVYDSTVRSYKISFNNFDGTLIENATFEYGKMPSCSKASSREATAEWKYSHKGWKPALDYVTGEATYVAIYDSSKVEYKVTFLNGTTVIDEQMIPYGGAAVAPTSVTRGGYKFVGWNTTFANVTENLMVKALFEELISYIIKVDGPNGEKIDSAIVEENGTYVLPTAPKKDGYTFDAYYDDDNRIGTTGTEITVVSDITITAKYSKNPESSSSSVPKSSSSSAPKSSSSVKSSSSDGGSQVVIEGELEQTVFPGAYIDPIIFKNVKKYNRNSSHITFIQTLPSQGSDELAIVGLVPESYKAGVYTESWTINGSIYTVKLTIVSSGSKQSSSSSSSVKSSSSSAKTSIAMQKNMPQFDVTVGFHSVQISSAKVGTSYALLDMQGRVLRKGRVESANFNIAVPNAGQYFVGIDNQIRSVNVK